MSRTLLAVMLLAFVVMAGCGSGPGTDGMFSTDGNEMSAIDDVYDATGADDEATAAEATSASGTLKLWLTGGRALTSDTPSGVKYYPMKVGETRPIRCTWSGSAQADPPVWRLQYGFGTSPILINSARGISKPPLTLDGNFVVGAIEYADPFWLSVKYGGVTAKIWIKVQGIWPKPGQTAKLNAAGARLKINGNPSMWTVSSAGGRRFFETQQAGELRLQGVIVPSGNYPGAPKPNWVADNTRIQFVGSATTWAPRFNILKVDAYVTAKIGNFAVTVNVAYLP